jgi:5-methylcytosine-specific restriction protein A
MPLKPCLGVDGKRCTALFKPERGDGGRCPACREEHKQQRYDTRRGQGYLTRQWATLAKGFLEANPLCADCGRARSAIAHHLHGLRPHSPGGMDPANLVPVCRSCHAKRHGRAGQRKAP